MSKIQKSVLDLKDRRILYELDSNARQPCSKIAKKVGLSTEVVNYRIKRLEEIGIITRYQTIVNLSQLNIIQFKLCITLQHIKSDEVLDIIEALKENSSVKWIVSCKGKWDIIISMETDSVEKVDSLKDEVLSLFEGHVSEKAVSILVEAETYNRNYLLDDKKQNIGGRIIMKKDKVAKLDKLNYAILKKLSENARLTVIEIASELKSTARIINYRIKSLEKNKVILGYKIALDYEKLGVLFYKAFIYLDNPNKEYTASLKQYLEFNKNIIHHVKVLGSWDLEPEFEVYSEKELDDIIREIKDKFSNTIKKIELTTISREHKFIYF